MGESHEHLLKVIKHCQDSLEKYTEHRNNNKLLHYLEKLHKLPIKVVHLEQTGVGRTVNGLRKLGGDVGHCAKSLVSKWKDMVVGEQEEEDDEDDDDEGEDGYQTGEEQCSDSDDKGSQEEIDRNTSSHRKSDTNNFNNVQKTKADKDSSARNESHTSSSLKSSKHKKETHHKHNDHDKYKSHKRKSSSSSSEDESPPKVSKKSESDDKHKSKRKLDSDSDEDSLNKSRKHKSDKHKSERSKKSQDSSVDADRSQKHSKSKEKHKEHSSKEKDKQRLSKKDDSNNHHSSSTKTKENEKSKYKDKEKHKSEDRKKKSSKNKTLDGTLLHNGIDSGSGASFAEALGMLESSSSKSSSKKKILEKKDIKQDKPLTKIEEKVLQVPKLLKEPSLEPLDLNMSSLLPPITPNYRPLGNVMMPDNHPKKSMTESEALTSIITSKNQRTKVYSGNKIGYGKVPSLFELCIRILQDNIDALEYTGGVPYGVLKPILDKATPNQLYMMEHHNPYLIEDTDELWQIHCQREFKNKKRDEMETWREMYLRCLDERDAKLKALTANIKQAQDKSLPVRTTKLAYVDAVAKPPRNIARKQAKNGTAFDIRKPAMTPSSKLSALATSGDAGKVSVPNPGNRAVERSSGHAVKPKKAPLMLKSISSFKNRFKR